MAKKKSFYKMLMREIAQADAAPQWGSGSHGGISDEELRRVNQRRRDLGLMAVDPPLPTTKEGE